MSGRTWIAAGLSAAAMLLAGAVGSRAMTAKSYQVTGPVLEVSPTMLVVQKGKDRWEIAVDASSGVPPGLKAGDKVTVEYRMTATSVSVKPAGKMARSKPEMTGKGGRKKGM